MAINPDLTEFNERADRWLREHRPDRYDTDDAESTAWLDQGAEALAKLVPKAQLREFVARQLIGRREAQATRSANRLLRKIGETGQLVLDWWDEANDPISIVHRHTDDDGIECVKRERVALRAATPADLRAFAVDEERRSEAEHKSRLLTCDAARWVADQIDHAGTRNFASWAQTLPGAIA